MANLDISKILISCSWICVVIIGNINAQQQNGGNLRLNPYTLQYLKQLLSRGGYQHISNVRTQQINVPNNIKYKALSLNPAFKGGNTKYNIKPVGVNPQLVKALYGSTFLKPNSGKLDAGKYSFAQVKNSQQQPRPTVKSNTSPKKNPLILAVPNLGSMLYQYAKQQEITQKQGPTPSINQNLYKMFGQMTYGPMPKPSNFPSSAVYRAANQQQSAGYRPQVSSFPSGYGQTSKPQSTNSFNKGSGFGGSNPYKAQAQVSSHQQPSQPSYRPQQQHQPQPSYPKQPSSYQPPQQPTYSQQQQPPSYQPKPQTSYQPSQSQQRSYSAPVQQKPVQSSYPMPQSNGGYGQEKMPMSSYGQSSYDPPKAPSSSYGFSNIVSPKEQQDSGYGQMSQPSGREWGGSIHISGSADGYDTPSFTGYESPMVAPGYGQQQQQQKQNTGYGQQQSSGYKKPFIGAGTTCSNVDASFCHSKKAGHYAHPHNRHCFMQCDAFGRGYDKECAPGTSWKGTGSEPAYYNMCS